MLRSLVLVALIASPALSDDFAERWPPERFPLERWLQPEGIDPVPTPVQRPPRVVRSAHAQARYVCHHTYYYRGQHRFWRCRR
jgi:hypothetical protein